MKKLIITAVLTIYVVIMANCSVEAAPKPEYVAAAQWLRSLNGRLSCLRIYSEAVQFELRKGSVIVMDFDETVGDNTQFELQDDTSYQALLKYQARGVAEAVPGAIEFITSVRERGAHVIILTARKESQREATEKALAMIGAEVDQVILCGSSKKKPEILEQFAKSGKLVMTAGDKPGDHYSGVAQIRLPNEYYGGYTRDEIGFFAATKE